MKVFVFGNPLIKEDALALKVGKKLRKAFPKIELQEIDSMEELNEELGEKLLVLDVVKGLKKVELIEKLESLENAPRYSMHDFDAGMHLKILKKFGLIKEVKIIGIPMNYPQKKALKEVSKIISTLLSKNE